MIFKKIKMNLVKICLCFVVTLLSQIRFATAGSCYAKMDIDGKCSELVANDVSQSECCTLLGVGFDEEMSDASIFMLHAGIKKQSCKPCRDIQSATCDKTNCGVGKRCIMKKGLPKCVCAPNCKATAAANKQQKLNNAKKIAVFRMPEKRHLKRTEKRLTPSDMQNDEPTLIVANFNRRQSNKKKKVNENESLIYSPLINADLDRQVQILQTRNTSNATDTVESKIRDGFFNDNTISVTSWVDALYIGNLPKFSHYNPICGSDGKTYKNECQLRKRACRQENKMLDVASKGHCQSSCQFIKCSNGKTCIEDQNSVPQCVSCPRCSSGSKNLTHQVIAKTVCGADGVTYRSLCELRQKSCKIGRAISMLHRGPCIEAANCNQCSKNQKCLPDLMTHKPKCVACNYKCPRKRRPATGKNTEQVCGRNNITYHSYCHMLKDSCNTGFFIDTKHTGRCTS